MTVYLSSVCGAAQFVWLRRLAVALLAGGVCFGSSAARAEEPAAEFLEALRGNNIYGTPFYDMALLYLERMENSATAPAEFQRTLLYQKGITLAEASQLERDLTKRAEMLDEANAALSDFIKQNPRHRLTPAANNQLGNLLVKRARMAIERAEKPSAGSEKSALLASAGKLFDEAFEVFTASKEATARDLKGIKPNLDPQKDAEEIERRDELRKQYLQSQLLSAAVLEEKADTAGEKDKQYTELLTKAADEYKDIYEKYRTRIAGLYAHLYRGRCEQKMGKHKEALSTFGDLLDQPDEAPEFRLLITKTLLLATASWKATDKLDTAVNKGLEWLGKVRPNESDTPEWMELRLRVAEALKTLADGTEDKKLTRQYLKDARELANKVARSESTFKRDAQKLLLTLGSAGDESPDEKLVATNFDEAKAYGREAIERMQSNDFALKNLPPRIQKEKDPAIKAELEKQLKDAAEQKDKNRADAKEYFEQAIAFATPETPVDDLNVVRYFLCYLNYVEEDYYRAAVIGDFLARRYPNSSGAKPSSKIAMAAYLKLYGQAPEGEREFETRQAIDIADYITQRWPEAPEATDALNTLIPFMIRSGDLERAMTYVAQIPADSPVRGKAELKTGQAMWSTYLREMHALNKAEQEGDVPADKAAKEAELEELKTKAQQVLTQGVARMKQAGSVDATVATAVLSLAQIYVELGQPEEAVPLMEDPEMGALSLVVQNHPATTREGFAPETYKTALRAYIGSLAETEQSDTTIQKARAVMAQLKKAMGETPQGQQKLVAIYVSLAKDLEQQLEISDEAAKQSLSKGFETFLAEVGKTATEFNVLNWVAETFYSLGQGFDDGSGQLTSQARDYYQRAIEAYRTMLAKQKSDPSYMGDPERMPLQIKMRMAMTLRRMGDYEKSLDMFAEILEEKNSMLNVQVEAALTFQEWGAVNCDEDKYRKAISGDRMNPEKKKNTIWGWGRLSQTTARYPQFRETFHVARYNLALARYNMALCSGSNETKMKYLSVAKKDISITQRLFPELGGEAQTQRYNKLLQKIQQALGEKPQGLKEFEQPVATAAK